jgi:hypothetical protein
MPRAFVHRINDGKMALKVVDGFMMYTSAALLYDTLARVLGPAQLQQGVLKHPKQKYWIGLNQVSKGRTSLGCQLELFL